MVKRISQELKKELLRYFLNTKLSFVQIAKNINFDYDRLYYYFLQFQKEGIINKDRSATNLTKSILGDAIFGIVVHPLSTTAQLQSAPQILPKISIHDLILSYDIIHPNKNWQKNKESILLKNKLEYELEDKGTHIRYNIKRNNFYISLTTHKILFVFPQLYVNSIDEVSSYYFQILKFELPKIVEMFGLRYKEDLVRLTIAKEHIALINDAFAEYFIEQGINLKIYDKDNNKVIAWIDDSEGQRHLEFAREGDARRYIEFSEDLFQSKVYKFSEILNMIKDVDFRTNQRIDMNDEAIIKMTDMLGKIETQAEIKGVYKMLELMATQNQEMSNGLKNIVALFQSQMPKQEPEEQKREAKPRDRSYFG